MSQFESNCAEIQTVIEKYDKDTFLCDLLKYLMTLDYKSLLLDCLKDMYRGCDIVCHPKLARLSQSEIQLCMHAIFKILKEQSLIDEIVEYEIWQQYTSFREKGIIVTVMRDSSHRSMPVWRVLLNESHGTPEITGLKRLPHNVHFISQ